MEVQKHSDGEVSHEVVRFGSLGYNSGNLHAWAKSQTSSWGPWVTNPDYPGDGHPYIRIGHLNPEYDPYSINFASINVTTGAVYTIGLGGYPSAFFDSSSYQFKTIWNWNTVRAVLGDTFAGTVFLDYKGDEVGYGGPTTLHKTDYLTDHWYSVGSAILETYSYVFMIKREGFDFTRIVFRIGSNPLLSHLGENVVSFQYDSVLYFYEFGTHVPFVGGYKTLIKDQDNFVVIDTTSVPQRLEASKPYPLATFAYYYGAPVTGMVTPGVNSEWVRMIYLPTTSGLGTGVTLSGYSGITDLRLFSLYAGDSIPISGVDYVTSGSVSAGVYVSGVGVPIHDVDPIEGDWTILTPISGAVGRFETTNYGIPYFFIASMSGTTIPSGYSTFSGFTSSGNIPSFLQRNPTSSGFVDYSTGLPGTEITVIRCDDRV